MAEEKPKKIEQETPTFQHPQQQTNQPSQDQIAGIDTVQDQQITNLQSSVSNLQNKSTNLNSDIIGLLETVGSAPTGSAFNLWQQLKIKGGNLYFYDATNNVWHNTTAGGLGGSIRTNAASTPFPSGWSMSHLSAGRYQVTHNLGTTLYAVALTVAEASETITILNITAKASNTFNIECWNQTAATTWASTDTDVDFIVSF